MITLEANYSKKIGLPGYSSHQFSITIKTEIQDVKQVHAESYRIYHLLQESVDQSIKEVGFIPQVNGSVAVQPSIPAQPQSNPDSWQCTAKQQDLLLKIVDDYHLDKHQIDSLAQDRYQKTVKALTKQEMSGFIDELLAQHGTKRPRTGGGLQQNHLQQRSHLNGHRR